MPKNLFQPIEPEVVTHQGKVIEVVTQKMQVGDKVDTFEWARRSPGARLIIHSFTNKILLTKEYRYELKTWDYRLPGGKVFDTLTQYNQFLATGKDILPQAITAAQKEAREETGVDGITNINHFYTSKCGATVEWDLFYFVVKVDSQAQAKQVLDHGENIHTSWYSLDQVKSIAFSGQMQEDRSVATLLRYLYKHNDHQEKNLAGVF